MDSRKYIVWLKKSSENLNTNQNQALRSGYFWIVYFATNMAITIAMYNCPAIAIATDIAFPW